MKVDVDAHTRRTSREARHQPHPGRKTTRRHEASIFNFDDNVPSLANLSLKSLLMNF